MPRKLFRNLLPALLLCVFASSDASAQDFQRTYNLAPGGAIQIRNVSGDIQITGYDGNTISVTAFKEGRDRDKVQVEDLSTPERVSLRAKYDEDCNCDASLRFEVKVPRSVRYNFDRVTTASGDVRASNVTGRVHLQTASGQVELQGVSGEIEANSASGNVRVRDAAGAVRASTASGDVEVELTRLEGAGDLKFSSASGNVSVRMPSGTDARVHLSTLSGSIDTNFPIEVEKPQHGPGQRARGQLGAGTRELRASSASGNVSLKTL